ncbi:hypothetical protein RFF05_14715 [Bengtsoniella intestinalis]|uniref:hypothetical protein n=1 Tax=Bengtsoniella intestinalis TaxID=3073143 RepID=UPI00391F92D1
MNLTPQTRKQQFYQEIGRILMERPEKGTNNDDENVFKFIRFDLSVLDAVIKIFEPKTVEDLHKLINCFCSESYSFKVDEDVTTLYKC